MKRLFFLSLAVVFGLTSLGVGRVGNAKEVATLPNPSSPDVVGAALEARVLARITEVGPCVPGVTNWEDKRISNGSLCTGSITKSCSPDKACYTYDMTCCNIEAECVVVDGTECNDRAGSAGANPGQVKDGGGKSPVFFSTPMKMK